MKLATRNKKNQSADISGNTNESNLHQTDVLTKKIKKKSLWILKLRSGEEPDLDDTRSSPGKSYTPPKVIHASVNPPDEDSVEVDSLENEEPSQRDM